MNTNNRESLDELRKNFSDIPFSIILKADVITNGIKINKDIILAQRWFFTNFFYLPDKTNILAMYNRESPYEIKFEDKKFHLLYENQIISQILLLEIPNYIKEIKPDQSILFSQRSSHCAYVSPINACQYFFKNEQCKFCNFNDAWEHLENKKIVANEELLTKITSKAIEEVGLNQIKLTGGALYNIDREAEIYISIAKKLKEETKIEHLFAYPQALKIEHFERLKEVGVEEICIDLEIWDERIWENILPAKGHIGREKWINRMIDATDVFGVGQVSTSIVAGYDYVSGCFESIDNSLRSNVEGFEWLVEKGIIPVFFAYMPSHSIVEKSRNEIVLPTSYALKLVASLHNIFLDNDIYKLLGYNINGDKTLEKCVCRDCGYHNLIVDFPALCMNSVNEHIR